MLLNQCMRLADSHQDEDFHRIICRKVVDMRRVDLLAALKPKIVIPALKDNPDDWVALKDYFKRRQMFHQAAQLLFEIAQRVPREEEVTDMRKYWDLRCRWTRLMFGNSLLQK